MLKITALNVGKGDCLVLECEHAGATHFAVIDSNADSEHKEKLANYLRARGVKSLRFLMITHPHVDHYKGLLKILTDFDVVQFLTFPLDTHLGNPSRLQKLLTKYAEILKSTDDKVVRGNLEEFIRIIAFAAQKYRVNNDWDEPTGPANVLNVPGFTDEGVIVSVLLPLRSVKGIYFSSIDDAEASVIYGHNLNDLSLAVQLDYAGRRVILGGDATEQNWMDHRRKKNLSLDKTLAKADFKKLDADIVKLPHHGSATDSSPEVLDYLFRSDGERFGLISANGTTHPHRDTLAFMVSNAILPYCTNLARDCGNTRVNLHTSDEFEPALARYIATHAAGVNEPGTPCQGNIAVSITPAGAIDISTETGVYCPYRDKSLSTPLLKSARPPRALRVRPPGS